jgi:predicted HicB family RNase H-like nuclease
MNGAISLKVLMDACQEDGVEPFKTYSGKFFLKTTPLFLVPPSLPARV